jgi:glycolate oxidase FAD binding subunit
MRGDSNQSERSDGHEVVTLTVDVASRLAEVLGPRRVINAPEELAGYSVDELTPSAVVRPANAEEVAEVVRFAIREQLGILPLGSRSKCDMGMPPQKYDIALDMTGLFDIAHYDAGDLTLSVDAGISLRELDSRLKAKGQFLPLAVPCFESATAGGAIASGIDSALRARYGTARDFLIGSEFVDGTGKLCKSGGRVVKNVTGYDLHKLLIGSLGTLGIITRLNFRTFPLASAFGGHVAGFATMAAAVEFRNCIEKIGLPVSDLEVISPSMVGMVRAILRRDEHAVAEEFADAEWIVYSTFEGNDAIARRIAGDLESMAARASAVRHRNLKADEDDALGGMLREAFEWLRWASPLSVIWRFTMPEIRAEMLNSLEKIAESAALRSGLLVRACGVVYFAVFADSEDDPTITRVAKILPDMKLAAQRQKGWSTLLHAPMGIKRIAASASEAGGDAGLQQRVKHAFDPSDVFAPGRIVGGI